MTMRKLLLAALLLWPSLAWADHDAPVQVASMLQAIVDNVQPAAAGCSTPLDAVSQTFPFAGGVRKLRNAYAGKALNVTISSVATDIGFSGCDLDTSALSGCTSAGTCPVNTLYDQSGNGANCTNTGSSRPSLIVNLINGHPAIDFAPPSAVQWLQCTLATSTGGAEAFVITQFTSGNTASLVAWGGTTGGAATNFVENDAGDYRQITGQSTVSGDIPTGGSWARIVGWSDTNMAGIFKGDSAGQASLTNTATVTPGSSVNLFISGDTNTGSSNYDRPIAEVLLVSPAISSCIGTNVLNGDCATISNNQKTYYNIAN